MLSHSIMSDSAIPWTVAYQSPLSMKFSRQECWSQLPFPSPGKKIPNLGIECRYPALQLDSLLSEPPGKPKNIGMGSLSFLQGNFPTQKLNQGLLHCRWTLYWLTYLGSPYVGQHSIVSYRFMLDSRSPEGIRHAELKLYTIE